MRIFSTEEDDEKAYRSKKGMLGRSIRRGTDKAITALTTFGAIKGSDPLSELGSDAAMELGTKVFRRKSED